MSTFTSLFEQYALPAMEKRRKMLRLTEGHLTDLDLEAGSARFGASLTLPLQVLGTESDNSVTWLWAWAEEQTEMPEQVMRSSREMKAWLEQNGLRELALPSLDLGVADGIQLACLATEVCRASAFHRDGYEGGALFLLFFSDQIDRQPGFTLDELIGALLDLGSRYSFDHHRALAAYLRTRARSFVEQPASLHALLATGEQLFAEFDANGSVRTINGTPVA
jgi:hypothetical protein